MPENQPRITVPPVKKDLREERCGTCRFYQPIDPQNGQCRRNAPTAQFIPNENYVSLRSRKGMTGDQRKEADAQPAAMIMYPYPWPTMMADTDWCGAWEKQKQVKIVKNMPNEPLS